MIKLPFNREKDWPFKELTHRKGRADQKRMQYNADVFGRWLIDLLTRTAPRARLEGEKFHCQGVSLHPANNRYLAEHVDPWTWLDFSPRDNDQLALDEAEIDHWFDQPPKQK